MPNTSPFPLLLTYNTLPLVPSHLESLWTVWFVFLVLAPSYCPTLVIQSSTWIRGSRLIIDPTLLCVGLPKSRTFLFRDWLESSGVRFYWGTPAAPPISARSFCLIERVSLEDWLSHPSTSSCCILVLPDSIGVIWSVVTVHLSLSDSLHSSSRSDCCASLPSPLFPSTSSPSSSRVMRILMWPTPVCFTTSRWFAYNPSPLRPSRSKPPWVSWSRIHKHPPSPSSPNPSSCIPIYLPSVDRLSPPAILFRFCACHSQQVACHKSLEVPRIGLQEKIFNGSLPEETTQSRWVSSLSRYSHFWAPRSCP